MQRIRERESSLLETAQSRLEEVNASTELRLQNDRHWRAALVIQHKLYYRWKVRNERRNQGGSLRNFLDTTLKSERAKREQAELTLRAALEEKETILRQQVEGERQRHAALIIQQKLFHGRKVRNDRREQGVAMRDFLEHTLQAERARCEQVVASMETSATREAQKKEEEFQERLDQAIMSVRQEAESENARALSKQSDKHQQNVRQILREKEGEMRRAMSMRTIVLARHSGTARSQRMIRRVFSSWKFESDRAKRKMADDEIEAAANERLVRLAKFEEVNAKAEALRNQTEELKFSKETLEQSSLDASKAFKEIVDQSDADHEREIAMWEKKLKEAVAEAEQQQLLHSEETVSLEAKYKTKLERAVTEGVKREKELGVGHSRAMSLRTVKMMKHFMLARKYRFLRSCFRAWYYEFYRPQKQALLAAKTSAAVIAKAQETARGDAAELEAAAAKNLARLETELEKMGAENRQRAAHMQAKAASFFTTRSNKLTRRENRKLKVDVLYTWVSKRD